MGEAFTILNVFAFGDIPRSEMVSINAGLYDTMEYRDFQYSIDPLDIIEPEDIICPHPQSIETFSYSISHLYELWYIYLAGCSLAFLVRGFQIVNEHRRKKYRKFIYSGIKADRNM